MAVKKVEKRVVKMGVKMGDERVEWTGALTVDKRVVEKAEKMVI